MIHNQLDITKYKFFSALKSLFFIEEIILYGSRARKDERERSDIDLAVKCPFATEKQWLKVLDIIDDADTLLKIDCVRFDQLSNENPLRKSILKDGIILFQRREND